MSSFLLDTHVILWLATDPSRVPVRVRRSLSAAENIVLSAASAYEIAQKTRSGRLPHGDRVLDRWDDLVNALLGSELPLTTRHMRTAGELAWDHRDPFDRMLVAQARLEGLTLATKDERIRDYSGVTCAEWS